MSLGAGTVYYGSGCRRAAVVQPPENGNPGGFHGPYKFLDFCMTAASILGFNGPGVSEQGQKP